MTKTAEFGQPTVHAPQPGKCRVCGIVEDRSYHRPGLATGGSPMGWADHTETLCDNPKCIAAARRELGFAA